MRGTVCSSTDVARLTQQHKPSRAISDIIAYETTSQTIYIDTGMQPKTINGAIEKLIALNLIVKLSKG